MLDTIRMAEDIEQLFPLQVTAIKDLVNKTISYISQLLHEVTSIPESEKTLDNTVLAFDRLQAHFDTVINILSILEGLSSSHTIRKTACQEARRLNEFGDRALSYNQELYKSFISYLQCNGIKEKRTPVENYFIKECITDWLYDGLNLPIGQQERIKELSVQLSISLDIFRKNIVQDNHILYVTKGELDGVPDHYIKNLPTLSDGRYNLKADTYILETCHNEETRFNFWKILVNQAYPANYNELVHIIALRDKLARILGFTSFAQLDISNQMAKTPEYVEQFLITIIQKAQAKLPQELEIFKAHMPQSIKLSPDGKIKPWDMWYIKNYYKQEVLAIDEHAISEYFPFEYTFKALLQIIEKIFSVSFEFIQVKNLWHKDVQALKVYKDNILRGFILLDLFARDNKYTNMYEQTIIGAVKAKNNQFKPGVTVVVGSLGLYFDRHNVISFFHEFGHALHSLLGAQKIISFSGSRVKRDFVEMPSQMLEQWGWEPEILKLVSCHYKTGDQLPDEIIEKIIKLKKFDAVDTLLEQCFFAMESLVFFKEGEQKDIIALHKRLYEEIRPHLVYSHEDHSYASFDHLVGYGAKYYSYLWSRIFAVDLFDYFKRQALEQKDLKKIGEKYIREILSKGGSQEPETLLKHFLNRESHMAIFFKDLGI